MAYTSIHAIKATIQKSIDYITNPDKTDGELFVSTFACAKATAEYDFLGSLARTGTSNPNLAYHLIQSFAPGEVSFDEAHRIGEQMAEELLQGKYSYVLATHIEKNHVHNHIIFCAADNLDHNKFNDCKKTLHDIRNLSDRLCQEHGLSVIEMGQKKGQKYNQWQTENNRPTFKMQLKKDIRECIKIASDYDSFLELMKAKGYEIKGSEFGDGAAAYIAFKPMDSTQFIRGCERSLGKGFTKEEIKEKIESKAHRKVTLPKRKAPKTELIDTSSERFANSPSLKRWAELQNLKLAASAYSAAGSLAELEQKITEKNTVIRDTYQSIAKLRSDIRTMREIIAYAQEYKENMAYYKQYLNASDKDAWLRNNDNEMHYILFTGAERFLQKNGVDTGHLSIEKLKEQLERMKDKQGELQSALSSAEHDEKEMETKRNLLQEYIGKAEEKYGQKEKKEPER